jgi:ApaG protein
MSVNYSSHMPEEAFSGAPEVNAYELTTDDVNVSVHPVYLDEQSSPSESHYVWAYRVIIKNQGHETFQVRARTWHIVDANGLMQEVHGAGVVGQLPVLDVGDVFEYTSGTSLRTPSGMMSGLYHAAVEGGRVFDIEIPAFSLDSPYQKIVMN